MCFLSILERDQYILGSSFSSNGVVPVACLPSIRFTLSNLHVSVHSPFSRALSRGGTEGGLGRGPAWVDVRAEDEEAAEFGYQDSAQTSYRDPSKIQAASRSQLDRAPAAGLSPLYFPASQHLAGCTGIFCFLTG